MTQVMAEELAKLSWQKSNVDIKRCNGVVAQNDGWDETSTWQMAFG